MERVRRAERERQTEGGGKWCKAYESSRNLITFHESPSPHLSFLSPCFDSQN